MGIGIRELLLLWVIFSAIFGFAVFGAIVRKAGYSRWYGLLGTLPLVNIAVIWVFAYAKWPAVDDSHV